MKVNRRSVPCGISRCPHAPPLGPTWSVPQFAIQIWHKTAHNDVWTKHRRGIGKNGVGMSALAKVGDTEGHGYDCVHKMTSHTPPQQRQFHHEKCGVGNLIAMSDQIAMRFGGCRRCCQPGVEVGPNGPRGRISKIATFPQTRSTRKQCLDHSKTVTNQRVSPMERTIDL